MTNYDLKKMLIKELNRINDIEDEEQKKIASQQLMKKFEQQSKTSGIYAPNNSGNIASNGSINVTGIGHIINGSRIDKVGDISVKGSNITGIRNTQIMYSDNSKSTVVDNRDGIMQRSNIGNSSNKPFSKCPYCGEGLNLPKTPKFCPHCGEQMTI